MKVTVTRVSWNGASTVAIGEGVAEDGTPVRFAGDWRPMRDIAIALESGDEVEANVESWQVLG